MTPTDILREAETDLAALANLPGEIRAKVKAGVAELTRIRDAIDATLADLTGRARATLASLDVLTRTPEAAAASPAETVPGAATPAVAEPAAAETDPAPAIAAGSFAA